MQVQGDGTGWERKQDWSKTEQAAMAEFEPCPTFLSGITQPFLDDLCWQRT